MTSSTDGAAHEEALAQVFEGDKHPRIDPQQLLLFSEPDPPLITADGLDDMNLVELLLTLAGRRRPPKGKTISVPWEKGERSYYVEYSRSTLHIEWESKRRAHKSKIGTEGTATRTSSSETKKLKKRPQLFVSVKTPEDVGLPRPQTEDVLVALMKLSAREGFNKAGVSTTRYELLSMMRWHTGGEYYDRLDEIFQQLVHLTVETNALWDPKTGRHFKGAFHILESAFLEQDEDLAPGQVHIKWSSELMNVFEKGYMKRLDTDFFYSLSNPTTKRIYRWLDKHLTLAPVVEIDVLRCAHKVLGYGVSYEYPSQVIQKLTPWLDELYDRGFCRWSVEKSTRDSKKKFVFTRISQYRSVVFPRRDYLIEALRQRGVTERVEQLVDTYGWERCLRQIEYHDFKGDDIRDSGAWLSEAIEENYTLPRKLGLLIESAKQETARWCDNSYEGLTDEEKEGVWREVHAKLGGAPASENQRLQARNHVLLARRQQL